MTLVEIVERLQSLLEKVELEESVQEKLAQISNAVESLERKGDDDKLDGGTMDGEDRGFDEVDLPETPGGAFPEPITGQLGNEETWPEREESGAELPEPTPFDLPEGLVHDRFVTKGGMAEIHLVRDEQLNRSVAMKILRADRIDKRKARVRFLDEAKITAQLNHPGVAPVYRLDELPDGRPFFTMKALGETTLGDVLRETRDDGDDASSWDRRRLVDMLLRVCETVEYAHRSGVIHRDLKPDNVMVGPCGEVRVIDWGIARPVEHPSCEDAEPSPQTIETDRDADVDMTMEGSIVGTAAYMAPEQVRGRQDRVGRASDVFSLGAILYEILSGQPAFGGDSHLEVMMRVLDGVETPASELEGTPDAIGEVCDRALAPCHGHRFADAGDLRERLETCLVDDLGGE